MIPILCSLVLPAHADSYLSLHVASDHNPPGNFNEKNTGMGFDIDLRGYWRLGVGTYINSHYDPTRYIGPFYGNDHIAVGALYVDGYNNGLDADRLFPMPFPVVRFRPLPTRVSPSFLFAPISNGYVVLTSLDWRF